MLGYWRPHDNFQNWLVGKLQLLMPGLEPQILFHAKVLEKVYTLNLDPLKDLVANCYSPIGRPAQKQPELFRALVVMTHYSNDGITRFVERLLYIMTRFWPLPVALNLIRSPVKVLSMIFYTAFG
jgi:hypothetical protein